MFEFAPFVMFSISGMTFVSNPQRSTAALQGTWEAWEWYLVQPGKSTSTNSGNSRILPPEPERLEKVRLRSGNSRTCLNISTFQSFPSCFWGVRTLLC